MRKRIADETDLLKLAASLRLLREEHAYSQSKLADWVGVNRVSYTNYERAVNLPNVFILARIAELYGISVDDILHNPDVAYSFRKE